MTTDILLTFTYIHLRDVWKSKSFQLDMHFKNLICFDGFMIIFYDAFTSSGDWRKISRVDQLRDFKVYFEEHGFTVYVCKDFDEVKKSVKSFFESKK